MVATAATDAAAAVAAVRLGRFGGRRDCSEEGRPERGGAAPRSGGSEEQAGGRADRGARGRAGRRRGGRPSSTAAGWRRDQSGDTMSRGAGRSPAAPGPPGLMEGRPDQPARPAGSAVRSQGVRFPAQRAGDISANPQASRVLPAWPARRPTGGVAPPASACRSWLRSSRPAGSLRQWRSLGRQWRPAATTLRPARSRVPLRQP
eukprot:3617174-Alexandrium_andersonii.AAC.1